MNVEYINPFLNATINVLKTMAFTEPVPGQPYLKSNDKAYGDVSGTIGITGDNEGSLSVCFGEECILGLVSSMFNEEIKELNPDVEDAVGEITNMISGDARRELSERGIILKAAIPSVVTGKNHSIRHITKGPCIVVPFETPGGKFTVEICFAK